MRKDMKMASVEYLKSSRDERLRPWIAQILEAMGNTGTFVTDVTLIEDLLFKKGFSVENASATLGIKLRLEDPVYMAANRLRLKS